MPSASETKKRLYGKMRTEEVKKLVRKKKSRGKRRSYHEREDGGNKYTNALKGYNE